ncbi:MAG TPA: hypothetical protein VLA19_29840 [Herpetosiphonaceae bacterium]|nr:hypothetical protein [Herpetosiphonaceae bacterium]
MSHADDELANAILDEVEKMLERYRPNLGRAVGRLRSLAQLPAGGDYIDDSDPVVPPGGETGEDDEEEHVLFPSDSDGHHWEADTAVLRLYVKPLAAGYGIAGAMGHIRLNPDTFTIDADGVVTLKTRIMETVTINGEAVTINGEPVVISR